MINGLKRVHVLTKALTAKACAYPQGPVCRIEDQDSSQVPDYPALRFRVLTSTILHRLYLKHKRECFINIVVKHMNELSPKALDPDNRMLEFVFDPEDGIGGMLALTP